jgi:hypothetical protein
LGRDEGALARLEERILPSLLHSCSQAVGRMAADLAEKVKSSISYAWRGPSHTTTSCGCRERQALYARTSWFPARLQPLRRTARADTMGSRFTCSIPYLPYPRLYRPAVGLRFCCLGEGRTDLSKLEMGASYPGLEIIASCPRCQKSSPQPAASAPHGLIQCRVIGISLDAGR